MARQTVILENRKAGDGVVSVSGFNWFPIANALSRVPKPGFASAGRDLAGVKAISPTEQAALEDGSVREEPFVTSYPDSVSLASVQADLAARWTARKAAIDAEPATRQFYGRTWDGTTWSA